MTRRSERGKILEAKHPRHLQDVHATQYINPPQMLSFAFKSSFTIHACYCQGRKNHHIPAAEDVNLFGYISLFH